MSKSLCEHGFLFHGGVTRFEASRLYTKDRVFIIKISQVIFPIVLPSTNLLNGLLCRKEERLGLNSGNSG